MGSINHMIFGKHIYLISFRMMYKNYEFGLQFGSNLYCFKGYLYPLQNPMNYFLGSNLSSQNDSYAGMNSSNNLYMQLLIDWLERLLKTDMH